MRIQLKAFHQKNDLIEPEGKKKQLPWLVGKYTILDCMRK